MSKDDEVWEEIGVGGGREKRLHTILGKAMCERSRPTGDEDGYIEEHAEDHPTASFGVSVGRNVSGRHHADDERQNAQHERHNQRDEKRQSEIVEIIFHPAPAKKISIR